MIRLEYSADADDIALHKNNLLKRDWSRIGIVTEERPIKPTAMVDTWKRGQMMTRTDWQAPADGPNCLVFPQWLVPIDATHWAPLEGQYDAMRGTDEGRSEQNVDPFERTPPRMAPEENGPIAELWRIYDQTRTEPDALKRTKLVWDMVNIHIKYGPFFQGTVANYPQVIVAKKDLRNVPRRENLAQHGFVNPTTVPCPAVYDPETWSWADPDEHA